MTLGKKFEPVDLAAISGLVATVFGGILLVLATNGRFDTTAELLQPRIDAKGITQEEMGKNIVATALIEAKHARAITRAARNLNAETMTAAQMVDPVDQSIQRVANATKEQERSNTDRIEFVKGRSIINGTVRAKRSQKLRDDHFGQLNQRFIATAAQEGDRVQQEFRRSEPARFQAAIENETHASTLRWRRSQEQAGAAIVRTSLVEEEYDRELALVQERLGSLITRAASAHML